MVDAKFCNSTSSHESSATSGMHHRSMTHRPTCMIQRTSPLQNQCNEVLLQRCDKTCLNTSLIKAWCCTDWVIRTLKHVQNKAQALQYTTVRRHVFTPALCDLCDRSASNCCNADLNVLFRLYWMNIEVHARDRINAEHGSKSVQMIKWSRQKVCNASPRLGITKRSTPPEKNMPN